MTELLDAWQAALAAEYEAVFAYGVLGPRLSGDDRAQAQVAQAEHAAARDDTQAALVRAGHRPVAPDADYPSAYPTAQGAVAARALAVRVETACAAAWRLLYARAASGPGGAGLRPGAQNHLIASAVRAARWRRVDDPAHATTPFPGIE